MTASAREKDINGYLLIKDNPISKVGVFQYSGAQIGTQEQIADGTVDPNRIYNVYRPEEELNDPECIESFKLVPWTDGHAMLGSVQEGLTPPEDKGVQGVVGEEVYFDPEGGYLKGNLKVFSETMADVIQKSEKKELSIGYRCEYDLIQGVYNGQKYDAVQRKIRGNHLALVQSGRSGSDVAVLDHFKFTLDSKEIIKMSEEKKPSLEEAVVNAIGAMQETIKGIGEKLDGLVSAKAQDVDAGNSEMAGADKAACADDDDVEAEDKKETEDKKDNAAMDEALKEINNLKQEVQGLKKNGVKTLMTELNQRNRLADQISNIVGTFAHDEMTLGEVAKYGVDKLKLSCPTGQEATALEAFFAGRKNDTQIYVADTAEKSIVNIDQILGGL